MRGASSSVFRDKQTPPLSDITLLYCRNVDVENRDFCPSSGLTVGILLYGLLRKTKMLWLPDGGKNLKISLLVLTQYTNGQTDRQTPHNGIGHAYA